MALEVGVVLGFGDLLVALEVGVVLGHFGGGIRVPKP